MDNYPHNDSPRPRRQLSFMSAPRVEHSPVPRDSVAQKVYRAMFQNGETNPFTNRAYSERYRDLLRGRKKLPFHLKLEEFVEMYCGAQILIVEGETGCGKTTQGKVVACTQPRRIAARTSAQRVAHEMDVQLGEEVGYSVRFENMTDQRKTFLKFMTHGMLLREAMTDPWLEQYSTIIVDEAHERTLETDLLMGLIKSVVRQRPDMKVIIMSATINTDRFQLFFADRTTGEHAPIFKIFSRQHGVETRYQAQPDPDYVKMAIRMVMKIHTSEPPGDVLLFLTGEEEVEEACRRIKSKAQLLADQDPRGVGPLVCVPFYASMSPAEHNRIFSTAHRSRIDGRPPGRKIVVATNVAETSITIEGLVYVIDSGYSKQKVYEPELRIESLLVGRISQATAKQRRGRVGRTQPGKCYRLYTEDEYNYFEHHTPPEILRSNLATVVLMLFKLRATDISRFHFIDPPSPQSLQHAVELLKALGAVRDNNRLTALGKIMAEFPLDPQASDEPSHMAKMLIDSPKFHCSDEILTIVAMLSAPHVWVRPPSKQRQADAAKARLSIRDGDHLSLLNVFNQYIRNKNDPDWPYNNYLSARALTNAESVRTQLKRMMEKFDIELVSTPEEGRIHRAVRKALCSGYFSQSALKHGTTGSSYGTIKDQLDAVLHPSSGLDLKWADWVIYHEYILTTKPFLRTVTRIRPEWLLRYIDVATLPDGEAKRALERLQVEEAGVGSIRQSIAPSAQPPPYTPR
ncbi:hypothetical protein CERSUDRAFT_76747 [Gelatoporia subvermispora B]|uniref:RNA helicase n=1 Tax=Ceriporiopsis subvermispora (strain B) TaxID=914234 RepID=M2R5W3_CERS8|nr:hypothetical protein CERSUDRAFT_76747 [Gelatoporia subvermispora B]